ncbi:MAG: thermonuclease family protein [Proteobacteria bacterium]|nr:thermonuclease family protein [Pseudomonadota bacterium]
MRTHALAIITLCLLVTASPIKAETITGTPWWTRVVDGDTLHLPNHKIVLAGIDAPEPAQQCQTATGANWACGEDATKRLVELMVDEVVCELHDKDDLGRDRATCTSNGLDVAQVLVREGLAVAEYGDQYQADEAQAREAKRGIWAGAFMRPRDWRYANRQRNREESHNQQ